MKRIILLLTILSTLISNKAAAQPYYEFPFTNVGGNYSVGGVTVGFAYNNNGGAVYIDENCADVKGYTSVNGGNFIFSFNVPVAGVRIRGIRTTSNLNTDIALQINGASFALQSSNISSYSACGYNDQGTLSNGNVVNGNGLITITQPGITSVQIQNNGSGYWVFAVEILPLVTTANSPCAGSTLDLSSDFSGITSGVTYNWTGPNGFTSNLKNPSINNVTASNAGVYTVTASNGTVTAKQTQNVIVNPIPDINTVSDQTVCNGSLTNAVSFSSNITPVTYTWTNNNNTIGLAASGTGPLPSFTAINNSDQPVKAVITVTPKYLGSDTSCDGTPKNFTITVNPSPAIVSQPVSAKACTNSNVVFTAVVSNASTYQWQINKGSGFENLQNTTPYSGVSTSTLNIANVDSALNGYQYRLIATGACGSITTDTVVLNVSALSISSVVGNVSCNGGSNGSITINPSGGISPYTFNWEEGQNTNEIIGLKAGTYKVTVTDAYLCSLTESFTVLEPDALTAIISKTDVSCNGESNGYASAAVSGGTGNYTYAWAPSGGTSASASGLSATTYTLTITDANGCFITETVQITEPEALSATDSHTNVACNGGNDGTASVNVTGGTGTYTYSWAPYGGTEATAANLSAGTYTVTVTDANSCSTKKTITITEPDLLTAAATITNVSCHSGNNGSATVTATGGTGAYTYSWTPYGGTGATATGLAAGTYSVTVRDANNCTFILDVEVTEPANPVNLNTAAPSGITITGASLSGTASSEGINTDKGECLTEVGFVYAMHSNPTTTDNKINVTTALETFSSTLSGLRGNRTYYVRTYAINNNGYINYGNEVSFTTQKYILDITALSGQSKTYNTADPVLNYSASGFANGDTAAILTGLLSRDAGENAGKYNITLGTISAGADYTISFTSAVFEITKADQLISWNQNLEFGCDDSNIVLLTATTDSGLPVSFTITNAALGTISENTLTITGSGNATITAIQNGDQNYNAAVTVTKPIEISQPGLVVQKWTDVLFFDNSSNDFVAWQWYKDETAVSGATHQYYNENQSLNGIYYVIATDKNGNLIKSCPIETTGTVFTKTLKIHPNPVAPLNVFTLECDFSESQLSGATVSIFDISGKLVQTIPNVKTENQISAPSQNSVYIVVLSLSNGEKKTINLLVK